MTLSEFLNEQVDKQLGADFQYRKTDLFQPLNVKAHVSFMSNPY